jgi:hypothetical protein
VLHQLASPRRRNAPPLVGLTGLSEFLANDGVLAPIGLARSPPAVARRLRPKARNRPRLRGFRAAAHPRIYYDTERILSQALAPFQGFTGTHRRPSSDLPSKAVQLSTRSSRGFVPLQRFHSHEEPLTSGASHTPVTLRPQGFAPSRRLAPLTTCRACSIPVPLLGFQPYEALLLTRRRTSSRTPSPTGFGTNCYRPSPSGIGHAARSPPDGTGVYPATTVVCLLGLLPSEVSCPSGLHTPSRACGPSRASPTRSSR